jgi:hypothetical protein
MSIYCNVHYIGDNLYCQTVYTRIKIVFQFITISERNNTNFLDFKKFMQKNLFNVIRIMFVYFMTNTINKLNTSPVLEFLLIY